jgi:hypothetical protein
MVPAAVSTAMETTGATSTSSQASSALSINSFAMTSGHSTGARPIWAVSLRSPTSPRGAKS